MDEQLALRLTWITFTQTCCGQCENEIHHGLNARKWKRTHERACYAGVGIVFSDQYATREWMKLEDHSRAWCENGRQFIEACSNLLLRWAVKHGVLVFWLALHVCLTHLLSKLSTTVELIILKFNIKLDIYSQYNMIINVNKKPCCFFIFG